MPSGPRIRTDNVFGTVTDNPLTNSATTLNSAGLANLAAVSSAHAVIILDPLRAAGAPEAVIVTAHTGSATSATVTRGAYGTSARQHAAGTLWVHAPTVEDFIRIVTSSTRPSDPYEGQLIYETDTDYYMGYSGSAWEYGHKLGAWTAYTPTFTNVTVGNGTVTGRYIRIGRTRILRARFTFGSSGSAVSGAVTVSTPSGSNIEASQDEGVVGQVVFSDADGSTYFGTAHAATSTTIRCQVNNASGTYITSASISSTVPMTWAAGDFLDVYCIYEAAA